VRLFKRLFDKSPHALVAREFCEVVSLSLKELDVANGRAAIRALNRDDMTWFLIRSRQYGESGSHYGVAELTDDASSCRPKWLGLISTPDLQKVWLRASDLFEKRRPSGGHMMDEENRRRAYSEFADQLLFKLYTLEEEARK
jgi:hypothetical protein